MKFTHHFRQARPASSSWNLLKTLIQSIVFWSVFLLLMPLCLAWLERQMGVPPLRFAGQIPVGVGVFLLASVLNVWTGVTMAVVGQGTPLPTDCPRQLVVAGPYRWVRNPMALAGLTQGLGVAIALGSWFNVGGVVLGGLVWNYVVRPVEEEHLQTLFGDAYQRYRQQVSCWLPRPPRRVR